MRDQKLFIVIIIIRHKQIKLPKYVFFNGGGVVITCSDYLHT